MESMTLHRGRLIDHILLVVEDFEASKDFYTAVLSALEIPVIITANDYLLADELVVASRHSPEAAGKLTGRHHLAFQAQRRVCCDQLHAVSGRKSHFLTCAIPIINVGVIISLMNNSYP